MGLSGQTELVQALPPLPHFSTATSDRSLHASEPQSAAHKMGYVYISPGPIERIK